MCVILLAATGFLLILTFLAVFGALAIDHRTNDIVLGGSREDFRNRLIEQIR